MRSSFWKAWKLAWSAVAASSILQYIAINKHYTMMYQGRCARGQLHFKPFSFSCSTFCEYVLRSFTSWYRSSMGASSSRCSNQCMWEAGNLGRLSVWWSSWDFFFPNFIPISKWDRKGYNRIKSAFIFKSQWHFEVRAVGWCRQSLVSFSGAYHWHIIWWCMKHVENLWKPTNLYTSLDIKL